MSLAKKGPNGHTLQENLTENLKDHITSPNHEKSRLSRQVQHADVILLFFLHFIETFIRKIFFGGLLHGFFKKKIQLLAPRPSPSILQIKFY